MGRNLSEVLAFGALALAGTFRRVLTLSTVGGVVVRLLVEGWE
jgi:hypothetical protein